MIGALLSGAVAVIASPAPYAATVPDAAHQDVPLPYRGIWALDRKFCKSAGPAVVAIGARSINFYERNGFLDLGQINYAPKVPSFYGSFRFVSNLRFSSGVVRLEMQRDQLVISEVADPSKASNRISWFRCR